MNYRCPVCRSNLLYFKKRFGLYRCPVCSIYFLPPSQWPKDLTAFYERAYQGEEPSARMDYFEYKPDLVQQKTYFKRQLADLQKFQPGPLLDIGCGRGIFLEMAHQAGFEVAGLEVSETVKYSAPRKIRAKIKLGDIENISLPKNSFRVVTLFNVIEHLLDPLSALKNIYSALKPGGIILTVTPDIGSIWAKLFGRHWWGFKSGHLFFFNPQSLKEVLRRSGFIMIKAFHNYPFYYSPSQLWEAFNRLLLDRSSKNFLGLKLSRPKIPISASSMQARAFKRK